MAKKNQLKSGNYRIQAYDYTDSSGKRHYKSFTAPTMKECRLKEAEWRAHRSDPVTADTLTLYDAVGRYIEMKKAVLSPTTYREYMKSWKRYFDCPIGRMKVKDIRSADVQLWVSDLASTLSPKTVRNHYQLLQSTMSIFAPDVRLRVTLPPKKKAEMYCPSDNDIKTLLNSISDPDLKLAIMLGAVGALRRSEICALDYSDIHGNSVTVNKAMVQDVDKQWIIKQPKTYSSYRTVEMPEFVMDMIPEGEGRIIKLNPMQITHRFTRALNKSGLPHFRFHDLRHYSASIMHALGVPDQYIMERGGWESDAVMKEHYRDVIDIEEKKQTRKVMKHFEKTYSDSV